MQWNLRLRAAERGIWKSAELRRMLAEAALYQHAAVAEACVFAVPDDKWGESVAAHVVLKVGQTADANALDAFCAGRLAGFKRPRQIAFVPELIKNANGKVARKAIQAPYWAGHSRMVN